MDFKYDEEVLRKVIGDAPKDSGIREATKLYTEIHMHALEHVAKIISVSCIMFPEEKREQMGQYLAYSIALSLIMSAGWDEELFNKSLAEALRQTDNIKKQNGGQDGKDNTP